MAIMVMNSRMTAAVGCRKWKGHVDFYVFFSKTCHNRTQTNDKDLDDGVERVSEESVGVAMYF